MAKSADLRGQWLRQPEVRAAIILQEPTDLARVQRVIREGYASDLDEVELQTLTRDPFLIAAALDRPERVVGRETSKPSWKRHKRKVPDVCSDLGITYINDFEAWRRLDFRI
ncbi:DUF4411 family protein [Roseicella aquatilis]|uniref:DUF4411 family protein n=1 Tax=Roseicella aquatilis TaxID=2527868 RepID=UPI0014050701|nr:DUF4411 family protein [Roseicella aquatilis]